MLPLPSATTYLKTKCFIDTPKLQARELYLLNVPRMFHGNVQLVSGNVSLPIQLRLSYCWLKSNIYCHREEESFNQSFVFYYA
jgi:hypothetical protein